ncbi:hypothetical protein GCM10020000_10290 [Streptomyces olivoverticillatus]
MRAVMTVLVAWVSLIDGGVAWAKADESTELQLGSPAAIASGVTYRGFSLKGAHGRAYGHLLTVDLRNRRVSVDLLYAGGRWGGAPRCPSWPTGTPRWAP